MNKHIQATHILKDIHPQEWKEALDFKKTDILEYRNAQHFKNHLAELTPRDSTRCGIKHDEALKNLLSGVPVIQQGEYDIIKNTVRNNLIKRGIISDNLYETYKYEVNGEILDVGKLASGDPSCYLVPNESYTNYFYELYINISYAGSISDSNVRNSISKLLATIELLEKEHYYCKITLIDVALNVNSEEGGRPHNLTIIPLFSHRDVKSIETMSSILNEYLLRKFLFTVYEDFYGKNLAGSYGKALTLPNSITPVDLDEVELASKILDQIHVPTTR